MCACWNNHNSADGGIENVAVDAEGHSPFKDVKNFIFRMEVHRRCCAWRRDIFHNCIAAIHLCSVNPNTQLFSGDCLKPFDGVSVTDNWCTLFECMIRSKLRASVVNPFCLLPSALTASPASRPSVPCTESTAAAADPAPR